MPLSHSTMMTRLRPREIERLRMQTKDKTFQLENSFPGIFLAQGLAGGMLAGFGFIFAKILWTDRPDFTFMLATPLAMTAGATAGVIQASIIWALYRFIGIKMGLKERIVLTFVSIRLVTMFLGLRWEFGDQSLFVVGVGLALLIGLPIALLVGSGVKPWELFTFGSIVTGSVAFERRAGSYSVLGTLGTLPLRFLSIVALAAWLLFVSSQREIGAGPAGAVFALLVPASYPALSAYLTFRSPHKAVLVWLGILMNFPIFVLALAPSRLYFSFWFGGVLSYLPGIGTAFLIAWAIFLIARLTAPTQNPVLTLDDALRQRPAQPLDTWDHNRLDSSVVGTTLVTPGRYK